MDLANVDSLLGYGAHVGTAALFGSTLQVLMVVMPSMLSVPYSNYKKADLTTRMFVNASKYIRPTYFFTLACLGAKASRSGLPNDIAAFTALLATLPIQFWFGPSPKGDSVINEFVKKGEGNDDGKAINERIKFFRRANAIRLAFLGLAVVFSR